MTTETADPLARMSYNRQQGPFENFEIEKKVFNTGPCASKTLPSQLVLGGTAAPPLPGGQAGVVKQERSPEPMQQAPQIPSNESSNLSAAGSLSEEADNSQTPGPKGKSQQAADKKIIRKRKRPEKPVESTPRSDRKITEFIHASPKRPLLVTANGDSSSNDVVPLCGSPIMVQGSSGGSQNNRTTPTPMSYSSSDSNFSPPNGAPTRIEAEVQTDVAELNAVRQEDMKKAEDMASIKRLNDSLKTQLETKTQRIRACNETIKRLLIEQSKVERKQARERVMEASLRIGQFKVNRRGGMDFKEEWTDGYGMEEINKKLQRINQERNEIVNATQNLRKRKQPKESKRTGTADGNTPSTSNVTYVDDGFLRPELPKEMTAQEYMEQDEIYRLRKEHLKREEADLLAEKDRLERERNIHIREMKRVQYEEQSRYKHHEMLNNRYLPLSLLGKGGFSEVWRAFDLDENRYVACKIHHVNKDWKEDKKANYVKHAMREKDIHKSLSHPRIVKLFDLFTIDNDSFCTVLEYCEGNDLDFYLKQHKQIPEKEARCIIMQVVSALKYLGERKVPIIHYDLKPANILLKSGTTSGEIKITDFGLSKTMENSEDGESIELTSQGAGTYWYLPPETFQQFGPISPKISPKVDVWSVGVIFYQCIYGKRPFGHERTQQQILEEKTILHASEVHFPPKPPVSAVAQDFIRRCLQYRTGERADVAELCQHDLFKPRGQKNLQPPSPSSNKSSRMEPLDYD